jgi:hypothetical protein
LTFKKLESHLTNRETQLTKEEKQKKNTVKAAIMEVGASSLKRG